MNDVFQSLSEQDKSDVRKHVEWMRNEPISPRSLDADLPDAGSVTITINGAVFKKELA